LVPGRLRQSATFSKTNVRTFLCHGNVVAIKSASDTSTEERAKLLRLYKKGGRETERLQIPVEHVKKKGGE